jgi:regulator of sigma E protease
MVAFGLGFVVFVHELGHFLVAKACGVKCDKFYLGFDIAGLKLCRFQWGETEYGIGILPLGGYVKMLGQEDNPAKLREEMERAKQGTGDEGRDAGAAASGSQQAANSPVYDPRSFLAKSVPQRMAIVSAGVIMNMIFAFLMAVVAFSMGVEQIPCVVGAVFPGDPAWQADIRPGDRIEKIGGKEMVQFRDLQTAIALGDINPEKGVPIEVDRPGVKEPLTLTVKPDASRGASMIGVASGKTTQLMLDRKTWLIQKRDAVEPGSPAAEAKPEFKNGDRIVQINTTKIDDYGQINAELAKSVDRDITVVVARDTSPDSKLVQSIGVNRNPMRTLGVVMKMGEITAVQAGSPAAAAGILPGDLIRMVDGKPVSDPVMLPDVLRRMAGKTVELTIQREASKTPLELSVQLREPIGYYPTGEMILFDSPVEVSALGVTYRVLNRVDRIVENGPAAKSGLLPEDLVVQAKMIPPKKEANGDADTEHKAKALPFDEKDRNWPALCSAIQIWPAGTTVELTVSRQGKEQTVTITPSVASDWFNPDRGFDFESMTFAHRAKDLGNAIALGGKETLEQTTIVYRSLKKLSKQEVSARGLVGPVGLVMMALNIADQGTAKLLLFLTMLSANLAVINFLPIPLLDGGLVMFLLYEGMVGKPANERVQVVLTYIGLFLIILLMVWVFGLDFGWISRR